MWSIGPATVPVNPLTFVNGPATVPANPLAFVNGPATVPANPLAFVNGPATVPAIPLTLVNGLAGEQLHVAEHAHGRRRASQRDRLGAVPASSGRHRGSGVLARNRPATRVRARGLRPTCGRGELGTRANGRAGVVGCDVWSR